MKKLAFLILMGMLCSCEKEVFELDALGENVGIVGTWIQAGYQGDTTLLKRAGDLDEHTYGFILNGDGSFIERKNSGWCGTPPIAYANYNGTWEAVSDSLLSIEVGYWGGVMTYQIRIVTLDAEDLAIRYLYAEDMAKSR
jgi:hypothetical protein